MAGDRQMAEEWGPDAVIAVVIAFNDALNARDIDSMMRLMTGDCVFENTQPAPDGTRYEGSGAVRAFWEQFFNAARGQTIEVEDIFSAGDRCIMRWVYRWRDSAGAQRHVRGIDAYRLREGLISEKLSYVKG